MVVVVGVVVVVVVVVTYHAPTVKDPPSGPRGLVRPVPWIHSSEKVLSLLLHLLPHVFEWIRSLPLMQHRPSGEGIPFNVLSRHPVLPRSYPLYIWRMFPKSLLKVFLAVIGRRS